MVCIFVIISRLCGLGFSTFAGHECRWVARGSQSLISYPILNNASELIRAGLMVQIYVEEHYYPIKALGIERYTLEMNSITFRITEI